MSLTQFKSVLFALLIVLCCTSSIVANASDALEFSGFARLVGGYLDTDDAEFKGYDDSVNFKPDSLLGLQGVYSPIEEISITAQAILRANEDVDKNLQLEWLYLTYRPIESLQIKTGKLRTPFFTLSDVTDVGYAYPWINPPQQVYNAYLFDTFEGIDIIYGFGNSAFDASLELYAGRYDGDIFLAGQQTDFSVRDLKGIIGKIQFANLEIRVARYGADVEFKDGPLSQLTETLNFFGFTQSAHSLRTTGKAEVSQIGFVYDNLDYFARSEWVDIRTDLEIAPKVQSYYLTIGYNFSPFTLHLTYAEGKNEIGKKEQEISPFNPLFYAYDGVFNAITIDNLKSWTLGSRWDFRKNMAFKVEYSRLKANPGEDGFFTIKNDAEFNRKANLYSVGLEWVF